MDRAIVDYAQKHAGTSADLDALLEDAASTHVFGRDEER